LPTPPNSITVTALSLINGAMQEIGALAGGEAAPIDDAAWILQKLQRMIDTWNAKRVMVYANFFKSFTLVANLAPHTIGPGGTFDINQRPVEIPTIGLQLTNSTPNTEIPLYRMTAAEWADERVKQLKSDIPTKYYYEPNWPLGSIYFWPVPSAVNNVLLQMRSVIVEPTAYNASFTMPPGYWNLAVYELAIEIAPSFERPISADLRERYQQAKIAVLSNNIKSPKGFTADAGMPGGGAGEGFNYFSAQPASNGK
jgi:hypothetical protein